MVINIKRQVQEWKDVLLRDQDPAMMEKYCGAFTTRERQLQESGGQLIDGLSQSGNAKHLAARAPLRTGPPSTHHAGTLQRLPPQLQQSVANR